MRKISKLNLNFIIRASILYCILAASFSLIGLTLPSKIVQTNPVSVLSIQEVGGHVIWGLVVAAASLSVRYIFLGGAFALLIDSDHLIGLAHIPAISRMSHSIAFGVLAALVLMIIFGRKDYLLGATAFGGMLAHLSYDIFAGEDAMFPIYAPFYDHQIKFSHPYWLVFEIAAVVLVGVVALLAKRRRESLGKLKF